jgi:alcohol-forming fatty acyl-CoA reductase
MDSETIIKLVENFSADEKHKFEIIAKKIIEPFPNTYTFSKSLAEDILRKNATNLRAKIKIVRPSIITATYEEPIKGYTDNIYGLNGVLVGASYFYIF